MWWRLKLACRLAVSLAVLTGAVLAQRVPSRPQTGNGRVVQLTGAARPPPPLAGGGTAGDAAARPCGLRASSSAGQAWTVC